MDQSVYIYNVMQLILNLGNFVFIFSPLSKLQENLFTKKYHRKS